MFDKNQKKRIISFQSYLSYKLLQKLCSDNNIELEEIDSMIMYDGSPLLNSDEKNLVTCSPIGNDIKIKYRKNFDFINFFTDNKILIDLYLGYKNNRYIVFDIYDNYVLFQNIEVIEDMSFKYKVISSYELDYTKHKIISYIKYYRFFLDSIIDKYCMDYHYNRLNEFMITYFICEDELKIRPFKNFNNFYNFYVYNFDEDRKKRATYSISELDNKED